VSFHPRGPQRFSRRLTEREEWSTSAQHTQRSRPLAHSPPLSAWTRQACSWRRQRWAARPAERSAARSRRAAWLSCRRISGRAEVPAGVWYNAFGQLAHLCGLPASSAVAIGKRRDTMRCRGAESDGPW